MTDERTKEQEPQGKRTRPGTVVLVVLLALLLIICLQNLNAIRVQILFWGVEMPLIMLLAIVAGLAFGIGWLISRMGRDKPKK